MLRVLLSRALDLLFRRRREDRLSDEIQTHLDQLTDEYVGQGLPPADARLAARRAFGGVDQIKESYRDQRGVPFIDSWFQDVRFAARLLVKDLSFTTAAVLALALGIAVNTTVFTIANGMNLRLLPVDGADRIMHLDTQQLEGRRQNMSSSYLDYVDWRRSTQTFTELAAYANAAANVGDESRPADRVAGFFVTANTFRALRVEPLLGRDFSEDDDRVGAIPVVILAYGFWADRYARDPSIIGRTIRINTTPTTVIGVMPSGFRFPVQADLWQPMASMPDLAAQTRDRRALGVFGRLRDGVSLDQARAEFTTLAAALAAQYPDTNRAVGAIVMPFTERYVGTVANSPLPMMMVAAAFVLLIACANAANLLLARSMARAREIALRAALGASRARIIRQLLVESLMLAVLAASVALVFSLGAVRVFAAETADINLPYWIHFGLDTRVFTYLAAICIATTFIFGLAPAWSLSRTKTSDVLKEGGRGGSQRTRRWTGALLVGELALTVVLLSGAGLMVRSAAALYEADSIVDLRTLTAARLSLPAVKYASGDDRRGFYGRLQERLDANTAILSATVGSTRPFVDAGAGQLEFEGDSSIDAATRVQTVTTASRYFETLGLHMLRGRPLRASDAIPGQESVVVNEELTKKYFAERDPIGRRLRLTQSVSSTATRTTPWLTIVGVSPSVRQQPVGDVTPLVYLPLGVQSDTAVGVIVRANVGTPVDTILREEVRALDADAAVFNLISVERLSQLSRANHRLVGSLFSLFAGIAMLLSAMGLYAVTAYAVSQRTSEIGVRVALGAQRSQVSWMFLKGMVIQLAVGLTLGIAGSIAVGQVMRGMLRRTSPFDPLTFAVVVGALIATALIACLVPVRRASRLDPAITLRHD